MRETENNSTGLKALITRYLCDPVLIYTVIAMTAIMYHYCRNMLTAVYTLASLVMCILLFRLMDYMEKHKLFGTIAYIVTSLLLSFTSSMCMQMGADNYPISFGVWFMTPQSIVDFNGWYTLAIFLLFIYFMCSVIYYYTHVRYRIFMNFLIFIIPFTIYGKEAEQMPIILIILMSVGYIMLLVRFRELNDSDTVVIAVKSETWRSAGIYALLFAAVAAVFPKPAIEADRTFIESLISAERFTDRLLAMLGDFQESSSGGQYRGVDSDTHLFYVSADEELHFKTGTFSFYDYNYDTWSIGNADSKEVAEYKKSRIELGEVGVLTRAILTAAELDSGFAEEFGLSGYSPEDIAIPDIGKASIYNAARLGDVAPVPQSAKSLVWSCAAQYMEILKTGVIRIRGREDSYETAEFTYSYYRDTFFENVNNKEVVDIISQSDYSNLLWRASRVLERESEYYDDENEIIEEYAKLLRKEYNDYSDYIEGLLDYGDKSRVYDLAQEITKGFDSDYEKAKAIEQYFFMNDFIYDLEYVKSKGENVENFLFNTRRGVCFEYATSMVMLARASGIPARYCEGYLVSQKHENKEYNTNMLVTPKDAHGYPELYIEGYGWMTFEPTISARTNEKEKPDLFEMLMISGIILFGLLILILIFIKIYPSLSHRFFIFRSRRKAPDDTVKSVMYRLCRIYHISGMNTSHEAAKGIMEISGVDISVTADLFDAAVYGDASLSENDAETAMSDYISAYGAYREMKKQRRLKTA
ncbi:MAG: transglutaminase domain-containing protein [Ruminococcus sp.]|nr:transglutaminase domain-containing protein [Ruminococcus sp.]